MPWLASHMDVNALDAFGADAADGAAIEAAAVENVKRLVRPAASLERYDWLDAARPVAVSDRRVHRDQDGLAPDRRLSGGGGGLQAEHEPGDLEVDDQPGAVDEGRDERRRHDRGVDPQPAQHQRQHRARPSPTRGRSRGS